MFKEYRDYINDNPNKYWFKAKLFGWGWTPARWQGWAVFLIYLGLVFLLTRAVNEQSTPREVVVSFLLPMTALIVVLLVICYKTGERPRWQWGKKR